LTGGIELQLLIVYDVRGSAATAARSPFIVAAVCPPSASNRRRYRRVSSARPPWARCLPGPVADPCHELDCGTKWDVGWNPATISEASLRGFNYCTSIVRCLLPNVNENKKDI